MSITSVRPSMPPAVSPVPPTAAPGQAGTSFDATAAQQGGSNNTAQQKAFQDLMMQTAQGFQSQMQSSVQETMQSLGGGEEDEPEEGDEPL